MNRYWADISNNNGQTVDWKRYAAAGHVLVGLKATEGISFIDRTHATRCENAHRFGVWVAHYHFFHARMNAIAQANAFHQQTRGHFASRDVAVLDVEQGGSDGLSASTVAHGCNEWAAAYKHLSGHSTVVYSDASYLSDLVAAGLNIPGHRAWIAAYGSHKPSVRGYSTWAWQRTDGVIGPEPHRCAGIGNCDISELNWATYLRLRARKA